MADSMEPYKMLWADPCCHGNDIWLGAESNRLPACYILTLGKYDPVGDKNLRKWILYELGYDHQSVRSVDGKLSCRRTTL